MKKKSIYTIGMVLCLVLSMMLPVGCLTAHAAEVIATVQGKVLSGTTDELLKLSTSDGVMEIKLDSGTDTSECKILLPDYTISVSVSHGSDGYLHAVKISQKSQTLGVTVDNDSASTVVGMISSKTNGDILYLNTSAGVMELKLDSTTDMSGCTVLVANKYYSVRCARGSDAYMHAVSISDTTKPANASDAGTTSSSSAGLTPAPSDPSGVKTASGSVTGTVGSKTTETLLYLKTNEGEMQFVIEGNTDTRSGMTLTKGSKLAVSFYHGSDGYLHAVSIVGVKSASLPVSLDTSSPATVTGTVNSKSTEEMLYLDTKYGLMELKMDAVQSVNDCKVLVSGKKLTVTCARGADAYMHVLTVNG
ncbi:MAG: hypothetical protein ACI4SN_02725 [Lachnospiraceae bacterium]